LGNGFEKAPTLLLSSAFWAKGIVSMMLFAKCKIDEAFFQLKSHSLLLLPAMGAWKVNTSIELYY
jgi:hypothetical protein